MRFTATAFAVVAATLAAPCSAQDAAELAKAAQNPIADMISLPFQNNTNFNVGPEKKTQNILNIQPVYPVSLGADWNLITRTIVPLISQPGFAPGQDRENGLGDIQFSAFFSPKRWWTAGSGASARSRSSTPRATSGSARACGDSGRRRWPCTSARPGSTARSSTTCGRCRKTKAGATSTRCCCSHSSTTTFPQSPGRYLTFAPIITADWEADSGQRWTVPLGLGIGQIMRWGKQPVNLQASAYYNVERPDNAGNWQLRLQLQFLFPK